MISASMPCSRPFTLARSPLTPLVTPHASDKTARPAFGQPGLARQFAIEQLCEQPPWSHVRREALVRILPTRGGLRLHNLIRLFQPLRGHRHVRHGRRH